MVVVQRIDSDTMKGGCHGDCIMALAPIMALPVCINFRLLLNGLELSSLADSILSRERESLRFSLRSSTLRSNLILP